LFTCVSISGTEVSRPGNPDTESNMPISGLCVLRERQVVRHVEDKRHAARRGSGRSSSKVLLVGEPWVPEVNVHVYNAGEDVESGGVDYSIGWRRAFI
jgi:hypothetical protein